MLWLALIAVGGFVFWNIQRGTSDEKTVARPGKLFVEYRPVVAAIMARVGIELVDPPVGIDSHATRDGTAPGGNASLTVATDWWNVEIREDTQQVLSYIDSKRASELISLQPEPEKWKPAVPAMSSEEAEAEFAKHDYFAAFGIDAKAFGLVKRAVTFRSEQVCRGWQISFSRTHKGYPVLGNAAAFTFDDQTRRLTHYAAVPLPDNASFPEPEVKLDVPSVRQMLPDAFNETPGGKRLLDGLSTDWAHMTVSGPMYVHANRWFHEPSFKSPPEYPFRLAYVCEVTATGPRIRVGPTIHVDVQTGEIVGGDHYVVTGAR
jgi:hypothetical protein